MANELILIVEDNEQNQKLASDVLRFKGFRVLVAETAEIGVPMVLKEKPDLVLMDIHLPGMSGLEALHAIRADVGIQSTRIMAITASVMGNDRDKIREAGFDAFEPKPINLRVFLRTVAGLLKPVSG